MSEACFDCKATEELLYVCNDDNLRCDKCSGPCITWLRHPIIRFVWWRHNRRKR